MLPPCHFLLYSSNTIGTLRKKLNLLGLNLGITTFFIELFENVIKGEITKCYFYQTLSIYLVREREKEIERGREFKERRGKRER